jgi:hypothetical protein
VHSKGRGESAFHSTTVLIISDPTLSDLFSDNYIACFVLIGHFAGVKVSWSALIGRNTATCPTVNVFFYNKNNMLHSDWSKCRKTVTYYTLIGLKAGTQSITFL